MRQDKPFHLSAALSLIIGTAIVIGLADAALIASLRLGAAGAFQYIPPRLWVIAPLCWVGVAVMIAIPALAVSRRWGAYVAMIGMIVLFVAVRLREQSMARMAVGAIAAIVACAIAIWTAKRWMAKPGRVAAIIAMILVGAIAVGALDKTQKQEAKQTSANKPNVVLIFLDTVSHDAIFPNGKDVDPRMPNLARLAQTGTVFDRAYTTAPWTLPAHFSAVTGLPAHDLGVDFDDQRYTRSIPTLAQRYRRNGYRTAAVISNTFLNRGTGFDRGFDSFEQAGRALDVCRTVPGLLLDRALPWFAATICNWSAREVTDRAIAHLSHDKSPLFLLLNYMDAHDPYYVERECRDNNTKSGRFRDVPASAYRREHYANHIAAIRCIDRHLGRLFAQFESAKRETVIAVVADHGEQFGEHGLVRHGNSVYDQLLHVPLIIRTPRATPRRVTEPIAISALPQLLNSSNIQPSPVISFLAGSHATGATEHWSVVRGTWHYISKQGKEELYDLATDPHELKNVAATPLLNEFRAELAKQRRRNDDETTKKFRSLGYVN